MTTPSHAVKRYDLPYDSLPLDQVPWGEYVTFSDYKELLDENERLKQMLDKPNR